MKTSAHVQSLIDEGLIDDVIRQLMNGQEANGCVVSGGEGLCVAKVYRSREPALVSALPACTSGQSGARPRGLRQPGR